MNFLIALFNSIKAMLLSLITGMSDFLTLVILWVVAEMGLLAVSDKLSFGLISQETLFFGASGVLVFFMDRYRTQITGAVKGVATKILG
jgi:hypothetical protein